MDNKKSIKTILSFLFPKYYNKITWFVISAGVALMVTSIYEIVLLEILKLEYKIPVIDDYEHIYGLALIVFGLSYNCLINYFEYRLKIISNESIQIQLTQVKNHDQSIFEASDKILDESQAKFIFRKLGSGNELFYEDSHILRKYNQYFELISNHFIDSEINESNNLLQIELKKLIDFIGKRFFVNKSNNELLQMTPEFNWDNNPGGISKEEELIYCAYEKELSQLLDKLEYAFDAFRKIVKLKLLK